MRAALIVTLAVLASAAVASALTVDPDYSIVQYVAGTTTTALAFHPNGDLYLVDGGCLYRYPPKAASDPAYTIDVSFRVGCRGIAGIGIAFSKNGRLYASSGEEIDITTGGIARQAWDTPARHGIAYDARNGDFYVSDYPNRQILRIADPDSFVGAHQVPAVFYLSPDGGIDGLTVGPDGTLYLAGYDAGALIIVEGFGNPGAGTKRALVKVTDTAAVAPLGPDGISICGDASYALTTRADAKRVTRWNLTGTGGAPTYAQSNIATNTGAYNDFSAVDPKGCIYYSSAGGVGGIWRVSASNGDCLCFSSVAPGPCGADCKEVTATVCGTASSYGATVASDGNCVTINPTVPSTILQCP